MDVALDFSGPSQEAPEVMALSPHELPEFQESDLLHFYAGVGLDAPEEIGAAPRGKAVSLSRIPQEADGVPHDVIITTKDTLRLG